MPRTRLEPDARREQLLRVAADIVMADGTSALTMQSVADRADVSKALVHHYFDNRDTLILELFEVARSFWTDTGERPSPKEAVGDRDPREAFHALLHEYTDWFFDQIDGEGRLFIRLLAEPAIEHGADRVRQRLHTSNVEWWAEVLTIMGVGADHALAWSTMFNLASESLWSLVERGSISRDVAEEVFYGSAEAGLDRLLDG